MRATAICPQPAPAATSAQRLFKVVLINPYELGRQPFALASPTAWLTRAGFEVECIDLSLERLDPGKLAGARLVALYVGMHTATRIAIEALPKVRELAPGAHLCVYGLYAPMNAAFLRARGAATVLGGEFEPALLDLAQRLRADGSIATQQEALISRDKVAFIAPDRTRLPALARYAKLILPDGSQRIAGFAEGSRGCKHLCRHCPVVPVYQGRFRVVPEDVVMADIRAQVAAGARHISFGDPDFLNGPTHALRLARALHTAFPEVTFDATIKVQHLIEHAALLPELARAGCLFVTSAVESVDDRVLEHLDKHHSGADFARAAHLLRAAGIAFAPTFVAFTPWTTLDGYLALLERIADLGLVESVPPVQLAIRLLVPEGSYLLRPARLSRAARRLSIRPLSAIPGSTSTRASTPCKRARSEASRTPSRPGGRAARSSQPSGSGRTKPPAAPRHRSATRISARRCLASPSRGTAAPSPPRSSSMRSEHMVRPADVLLLLVSVVALAGCAGPGGGLGFPQCAPDQGTVEAPQGPRRRRAGPIARSTITRRSSAACSGSRQWPSTPEGIAARLTLPGGETVAETYDPTWAWKTVSNRGWDWLARLAPGSGTVIILAAVRFDAVSAARRTELEQPRGRDPSADTARRSRSRSAAPRAAGSGSAFRRGSSSRCASSARRMFKTSSGTARRPRCGRSTGISRS